MNLQNPPAIKTCPACNGAVGRRFAAREHLVGLGHPFTYGECAACATLFLLDPPADLAEYYDARYSTLRRSLLKSRVRSVFAWVSYNLPTFAPLVGALYHGSHWGTYAALRAASPDRTASVLDVGAGTGRFLETLRFLGFKNELLGVDPFLASSVEIPNSEIHVKKVPLTDVAGRFQIITLVHVLEHLPSPVDALRAAKTLLEPGGKVIVSIPIAGSEVWRRHGPNWIQLDPPRHHVILSDSGLARAAERAGLTIQEIIRDSTALQFWGTSRVRRGKAIIPFGRSMMASMPRLPMDALRALAVNRNGQADQSTFVLTPD